MKFAFYFWFSYDQKIRIVNLLIIADICGCVSVTTSFTVIPPFWRAVMALENPFASMVLDFKSVSLLSTISIARIFLSAWFTTVYVQYFAYDKGNPCGHLLKKTNRSCLITFVRQGEMKSLLNEKEFVTELPMFPA